MPSFKPSPSRVLALFVAIAATAIPASLAAASPNLSLPDPAPQRPFAATSVWNTQLRAATPLVSNSSGLVSDLVRQVHTYGPWINSTQYSTPVYQVPANQPLVQMIVDAGTSMWTNPTDELTLYRQMRVPIPAGALPAAGTDKHLVVWQPSTDTLWELWLARNQSGVWHIGWGSRITSVSTSTGINPAPFGATASGLPLDGGLITKDEIRDLSIPHALAMALPETAAGRFTWPANRTDGHSLATTAIPQGTEFRLDPALDVSSLGLPPLARAIALAAQRYGIVVRDTAGAVVFFAEDPTNFGGGDYNWGVSGGPSSLLAKFPWDRLQAVVPQPLRP
ncbi:MAG: hypothetical protein JWM71_957 [Solirubrobacteraceae bacterium]|nr:hypothetical protein [Solirubrobacteraceae bacterium]